MASAAMQLTAPDTLGEVMPGDDVAQLIIQALDAADMRLQSGDVLVIAQKIISKAEGRYRYLDQVKPGQEAERLAPLCDKDPRLVQLILDESEEVLRLRKGVIIVQHKLGYVHANAGIDKSNLPPDGQERVLLLPQNPDASSDVIRQQLSRHFAAEVSVIINDSAGRAWRNGTCGFAIGTAGFEPLTDLVGKKDRHGREMEVTEVAVADELAAAASFVMGQADESRPLVVIRGANLHLGDYLSTSLIRDKQGDLFR